MGRDRVWLFRGLVSVAAGLMVVSWLLPWWRADITAVQDYWVQIRPWGLDVNLKGYEAFITGSGMPVWFAPFAWTYFGTCIAALLYGSWLGEKELRIGKFSFTWAQLLIGGVGLSYIVCVVLAVIIAILRMKDYFDIKFVGSTFIAIGTFSESWVEAGLLFGYWLACTVGPLCVVLALIRNKIIGKPKLIT
jgi:hypothetical protein